MTHKRLLIILICFIVVAGAAVAGGTIFRVRNVEIRFTHDLWYLDSEIYWLNPAMHQSLDFVVGRSSLFGVNRDRITQSIEETDPRVRVTNIEVFAPNRLEVRVRERFPVFRFGNYALDMDLRFVTSASVVDSRGEPLICITGQIELPQGTQLGIGDFLGDFFTEQDIRENLRIEMLLNKTSLLWGQGEGLREDGQTRLISSIEFGYYLFAVPEMTLNFRNEDVNIVPYITTVRISDIREDYNFRAMLTHVWDVRAFLIQRTGHALVFVNNSGRIDLVWLD